MDILTAFYGAGLIVLEGLAVYSLIIYLLYKTF